MHAFIPGYSFWPGSIDSHPRRNAPSLVIVLNIRKAVQAMYTVDVSNVVYSAADLKV